MASDPDDALGEYKAQQATKRGFHFLKDPLFFTSSVFLGVITKQCQNLFVQ